VLGQRESGVGAWQWSWNAGLTSISRPAMGLAAGAPAVVDPQQTGARQGPGKKKERLMGRGSSGRFSVTSGQKCDRLPFGVSGPTKSEVDREGRLFGHCVRGGRSASFQFSELGWAVTCDAWVESVSKGEGGLSGVKSVGLTRCKNPGCVFVKGAGARSRESIIEVVRKSPFGLES
jgi:hypothetical protein